MSTSRSQLYRFARDTGNIEAIEHGFKHGELSGSALGSNPRSEMKREHAVRA